MQVALWNNVLNLRNGLVFANSSAELTTAVDMCRMNKNDTPDIMFGRHDATVLKRLISAFSLDLPLLKVYLMLLTQVTFKLQCNC